MGAAHRRTRDVEDALYERRSLLRMLGMRRTVFVVPTADAAVVQAAATRAVAAGQRRLLVKHLTECDAGWLTDVETSTYAALQARGGATAAQLAADEPRLRTELRFPQGNQYVTSRVLFLLAADGRIVRGRPNGTWLSSQYTWHPLQTWTGAPLPHLDAAAARVTLAQRWLRRYGPASSTDLAWWAGWSATHTKAALAALDTVPVTFDDGTAGVVLADDVTDEPAPDPWVALLPALDPTVMGWRSRDWYLGPHAPALFDRTGNPGPTVWADGQIVGGWAHTPDGRVVIEFLQAVPRGVRDAAAALAAQLQQRLGATRITPRFRTPLERKLSG